jgi:pimeloyl-ACP methyl ester carboxylesterase
VPDELVAPPLPPGRKVVLPGRGTTFVRELDGPPGAPVLLLLHGWTATSDLTWFASYERLSHRFRVLSIDNRGHGRGIRGRERFRVTDCADDAAAVLEVLGVEKVVACGYSLGGPMATSLWRRHPRHVEGLVLCATAARFTGSPARRRRLEALGGIGDVAGFVPDRWMTPVTNRILGNINARRGLGPWVSEELLLGHGPSLLQAVGELGRWDARPWIGEVDVPAAAVVPILDELVPPAEQRWQAEALHAPVYEVDGPHTACLATPEAFALALDAACNDVADRI